MKHTMVDNYSLDNNEKEIISKAIDIINNIYRELSEVPTICIDEQNIDPLLTELMLSVLNMELRKIYSIFNCLDDDARNKLKREITK